MVWLFVFVAWGAGWVGVFVVLTRVISLYKIS
jgi:hypothetical protein